MSTPSPSLIPCKSIASSTPHHIQPTTSPPPFLLIRDVPTRSAPLLLDT
jgi:hypothetical protein